MRQQNLLPGISLPAPRPARPADTPPAPSPAASDTDDWSPQEDLLRSAFVFEPAGAAAEPVLILGLDCALSPREGLAPARLRLIEQADVLCGGRRLLAAFDDLPALQLPLTAPLEPVLARISHWRAGGKKALAQTGLDHTVTLCTPDRFIQRNIVHISCINIHCYITPSCRFP